MYPAPRSEKQSEDRRVSSAATPILGVVQWDDFDATSLFELIRDRGPKEDAERTIRAFTYVLHAARTDPALLEHMLVAAVSLVALDVDETPRTILDRVFRRSVSDEDWRRHYAPIFG